jgi:hypothetical protein
VEVLFVEGLTVAQAARAIEEESRTLVATGESS